MLLSQLLAWTAAILALMEALRFLARISKVKALNRFFHEIHIPYGVLLLIVGGLHGLVAGNFPDAAFSEMELAPELFTLNWGTACYVAALLLGVSYLLHKPLKKHWMTAHRVLTVVMLVTLGLHLLDVGIGLPKRLFPEAPAAAAPSYTPGGTPSPAPGQPVDPAPFPDPGDTSAAAPSDPPAAQPGELPTPAPGDPPASQPGESPAPAPEVPPAANPEPVPAVQFSGATLADGVYRGSAQGYRSTITVEVTVEGGQATSVEVVSQDDTPRFFTRAVAVIDSILSRQSLEVDTVSGATRSAEAIKSAVYNALQDAVTSGELTILKVQPSSGHGRH